MLAFVKNWLRPAVNPIGVDFGSDSLKMAQVARIEGEWRLLAAASVDVPDHVRRDLPARLNFLGQAVRDGLAQGRFRGRKAVLALPAAAMFFQHLRLPKMDEAALRKALPWEARGKLPIDPARALLRHYVAGDVYQDREARQEIIVMAAGRDVVNAYLAMAGRARLDVVGMHVEPRAVVDCFAQVYRRKTDATVTNCFLDIGVSSTRVYVTRGRAILFARAIPLGGEHLTRAVATGLKLKPEDARLLRLQLAAAVPSPTDHQRRQEASSGETGLAAGTAPETATTTQRPATAVPQAELVEQALLEPLRRLTEELDLCRRYYESAFPDKPVDRLIFLGGEARHRWICQHIAQEMGLAAQVGDPLVRMSRTTEVGPESGLDRRLPQPNWAVAIGLSMGGNAAEATDLETT